MLLVMISALAGPHCSDRAMSMTTIGAATAMVQKRDPHILVVDDDHEIRNLLGRYLAGQDFRVSLAADLRTFRKIVATSTVDLAIVDVMLPDGSGLDLCRDFRAQKS